MIDDSAIPPAPTRVFGKAIRGVLSALQLPWRVRCSTVSFSGLGYGASQFARVETERKLTYFECSKLADKVRELRKNGVGRGIVELRGPDYAMGGYIGHKDYPSGADFWKTFAVDLTANGFETYVMREAKRLAEVFVERSIQHPDDADTERCDRLRDDWLRSAAEDPERWANAYYVLNR